MKFSHAALLIAASTLVAGPAFAAKKKSAEPPCVKGKVLSAFQMRMLQTELVVGALSCKLTPRYNDFVVAYRPDLMSAHRSLMAYFARESRLEDYKSRTANEVSQRSLANITEFCNYTSALYDKLLGPEKIQLADFVSSEPSANRHGQNACGMPSLITASSSGKLVPLPRVKPETPASAAAAAAPQPKPEAATAQAEPAAQQ
jgi:hypothetical protein